jgi:hypothetical protein
MGETRIDSRFYDRKVIFIFTSVAKARSLLTFRLVQ